MTIEQKAKRYDEAVKQGERLKWVNPYDTVGDMIDSIFPELKESEDEKIRKEIINYVKSAIGDEDVISPWIAWLEKQEQKPADKDDDSAGKKAEDYRNYRMSCGIKDPVTLNEIEEAYYEGAISKKPIAWSEEEEKKLQCLKQILDIYFDGYELQDGKVLSAEDMYDWLKSIKDRITWKPNEEQMEAFEHFVRSLGESGTASPYENNTKSLYSLLQDLKKLKG